MASRISQLSALTGASAASNDLLPIVDVSDTSMAASGTDKKITLTELQSAPVSAGTANGVMYLNGSKVPTAGSGLVFDSSGNLGIGVTPSAWGFGGNIELPATNNISFQGSGNLLFNAYYSVGSSAYLYKTTSGASRYQSAAGEHRWFTAPSGTAGNAITFTQAMTLDANGNLLVGTTNANANLQKGLQIASTNWGSAVSVTAGALIGTCAAWGRSSDGNVAQFYRDTSFTTLVGSISVTASATSYNTSSDYRLKDNQKPLTGSGEFIDSLKPKTWDWKADGSRGVGFIAHEVQEVSPTSVVGEKDATRIEQYEISPAVPATYDEEGNIVTPAVEAVMGEREVPAYQAMEYGSAEFIANIVAELQSLRKRVAALEAGGI